MNNFARRIHVLHLFEGFVEGDGFDFAGFQADHAPEILFGNEIGGGNTEAGAKDAVEGSGRAAALDVAEDGDTNFLLEHFTKCEGNGVGDVARPRRWDGLATGVGSGKLDAFGDDDEAETFAAEFAGADGIADIFEFEGYFGDQDDVCAAGDSGTQGDPTRVAAHHFDEHDPVMRFGGGVEAVNSFGGDHQGGVEAEGDFRGVKIVVDGFGNTDDVHSTAKKIARDVLGAVTPDDDNGVNAEAAGIVHAE